MTRSTDIISILDKSSNIEPEDFLALLNEVPYGELTFLLTYIKASSKWKYLDRALQEEMCNR
jgi:hypothetical protein